MVESGSQGKRVSQPGDLPLERVKLLTDVVFASAMTVMVLAIDIPARESIDTPRGSGIAS